MKRLIFLSFFALLLCGCLDTKLPKPTPKVPEPKAVLGALEKQPSPQAWAARRS